MFSALPLEPLGLLVLFALAVDSSAVHDLNAASV